MSNIWGVSQQVGIYSTGREKRINSDEYKRKSRRLLFMQSDQSIPKAQSDLSAWKRYDAIYKSVASNNQPSSSTYWHTIEVERTHLCTSTQCEQCEFISGSRRVVVGCCWCCRVSGGNINAQRCGTSSKSEHWALWASCWHANRLLN